MWFLRAEEVNEVWPDVYMLITTSSLPCGDVFLFSTALFFFFFFPPFTRLTVKLVTRGAGRAMKSRLKVLCCCFFFFSFCEKHLHP